MKLGELISKPSDDLGELKEEKLMIKQKTLLSWSCWRNTSCLKLDLWITQIFIEMISLLMLTRYFSQTLWQRIAVGRCEVAPRSGGGPVSYFFLNSGLIFKKSTPGLLDWRHKEQKSR